MNIDEIAEKIADDIFDLGSTVTQKVTRLQFISGEYPDNESRHGGMNKDSLTKQVRISLSKIF